MGYEWAQERENNIAALLLWSRVETDISYTVTHKEEGPNRFLNHLIIDAHLRIPVQNLQIYSDLTQIFSSDPGR